MAVSGDRHGTMIEIYPESTVMAPGDGEAPVDLSQRRRRIARTPAFHALLSVPHDRAAIERIGAAAGWRTNFFSRAAPGLPPVFHVVEVWVENRLLLEVVPADMIEVYESYMQIGRMDALGLSLQSATVARRQDLRGENDEWRECRRGPDRRCRPDRPVAGHHLAPLGHTGAHHRPQRPADVRLQGAGAVERQPRSAAGHGRGRPVRGRGPAPQCAVRRRGRPQARDPGRRRRHRQRLSLSAAAAPVAHRGAADRAACRAGRRHRAQRRTGRPVAG